MGLRSVIYARQSLDRSGEGAAVERQVEDCRRLADSRGWDVLDVITDNDISASTGKDRPGYTRVLDMIRAGALDVVVVWHVDRFVRRIRDLEDVVDLCEANGTKLATVSGDIDLSTDMGRMVARILAAVARAEVERKGIRQRRANLQRAEAGRMGWTRRPFAYDRDGGGVVVVEDEARALTVAATSVLAGGTLASAVRGLDVAGHVTTAGKPWNVTSLRRALLNPRYAGTVTYAGTAMGEGAWPVVLDADLQAALADVLRDPSRRMHQGTELKYLLSGLALCGRCGDRTFASPMGPKGGRWMVYRCRTGHLARRLDLVDEVVVAVVLGRLARPDAVALLSEDDDTGRLRAEADDLRERRDALALMVADGLLGAAAARKQAQRLTDQLRGVEGRVTASQGSTGLATVVRDADPAAAWDRLDLRSQRGVVDVLATVTLLPAGKGVRFDPAQVSVGWKC